MKVGGTFARGVVVSTSLAYSDFLELFGLGEVPEGNDRVTFIEL